MKDRLAGAKVKKFDRDQAGNSQTGFQSILCWSLYFLTYVATDALLTQAAHGYISNHGLSGSNGAGADHP
jgi:hypothetical protein